MRGNERSVMHARSKIYPFTPAFRLRAHALRRTQTRRSSRSERRPGRGGEREISRAGM